MTSSGLRLGQMVNQFPYEAALVVKSHLARTIQQEFGSGSPEGDAMQPTFDMQVPTKFDCFMRRRFQCHKNCCCVRWLTVQLR